MASNISQVVSKGKEQFRDGDGEEDEEEEILDPRVKVIALTTPEPCFFICKIIKPRLGKI